MSPKKLTFTLIGLIVVLVMLAIAAFWFSNKALEEKSQELSRVLADISFTNEQLDSLGRLEQEYEDISPLENMAYQVLPKDKKQTEVTLQLQSIVSSVGLELGGLSFQSTAGRPGEQSQTLAADLPGVLMMPVQFQIASSYNDFVELLQVIENQQRYMQISNLSISRSGDELQFNVSLEVFLQP